MPVAGIVTLIGVAATVVVLAGYLIAIVFILKHVTFTLGTVIAGVRSIALQTQPLASVVGEINRDLDQVRQALDRVVTTARPPQAIRLPEPEAVRAPAPSRRAGARR